MKIGKIEIHWLRGGKLAFDGGAMFGVVPKALWKKKYPVNEANQIAAYADPIYLKVAGKHVLIDAGLGVNRLTEKQKRNFSVEEESFIVQDLARLGVTPEEIDFVLMTHLHFDHVTGLTGTAEDGTLTSVFPNAKIIASETEWDEMRAPNIRSKATYWPENWQKIEAQIHTYSEKMEVLPGVTMHHTGGHSAGHGIVEISSDGMHAVHLGDIFPTHAHLNPLWVTAYDDYPMDSIFAKEKLFAKWMDEQTWFLFYHDAFYEAIQLNRAGEITNKMEKKRG
ncbi:MULTISPECIES: MBL fold metallo-hydrolase [Listeria]|uniref:YtnP family quorum-quenching lactonase n=1 Tax=Listeria TaxID=1637 RepID=UPI000B5950FE|nr:MULTISPECIES: MBL fold metallo-hydrolase [Listeria]